MRPSLRLALALALGFSAPSGAGQALAENPPSDQPAALAQPAPLAAPDLDVIEAVVLRAREQLATLDGLIVAQEAKLDDLYQQRDAAEATGQDAYARRLDPLIDAMNLSLTQMEGERADIAATIDALATQIGTLRATQQDGQRE